MTFPIIPKDVTQIEDAGQWDKGAFSGCTGLTSVSFPASLTAIGKGAFLNCSKLANAVFADRAGWAVYSDKEYTQKTGDLDPAELGDAGTAAGYLPNTYAWQYWKKN